MPGCFWLSRCSDVEILEIQTAVKQQADCQTAQNKVEPKTGEAPPWPLYTLRTSLALCFRSLPNETGKMEQVFHVMHWECNPVCGIIFVYSLPIIHCTSSSQAPPSFSLFSNIIFADSMEQQTVSKFKLELLGVRLQKQ